MRLPLSANLILCVAGLYVIGRIRLHFWGCTYRLNRACRLYDAGRIAEGDRVWSAVKRSRAAYQIRHPHWRTAIEGGAR